MSTPPDAPTGGAQTAEPASVRPLDALALRLIATWAAQERDRALTFSYDGDPDASGAITVLEPDGGTPGTNDVTITASTQGRPLKLGVVTASVNGLSGQVDASEYGAVFWSEASVQKFLGPYLAAIAGGAAAEALYDLEMLWNHYPDDRRVFAVLHRTRRRPGQPLSLRQLLDVWFLDLTGAPRLDVMPAEEFLPLCGVAPVALHVSPVAFRPGTLPDGASLPTEFDLRRMAEWSSALRDQPRYFVVDGTTPGLIQAPVTELPGDLSNRQVIPVFTPMTRVGHLQPGSIRLVPDAGDPVELTDAQADAAFWSSGTVDKVLLPYYALAYGAAALDTLLDVYDHWIGQEVVLDPANDALAAPSGSGDPPALGTQAGDPAAYALIHLPKSDWGVEGDGVTPALAVRKTLAVAHAGPADETGRRRTRLTPLSELPGR